MIIWNWLPHASVHTFLIAITACIFGIFYGLLFIRNILKGSFLAAVVRLGVLAAGANFLYYLKLDTSSSILGIVGFTIGFWIIIIYQSCVKGSSHGIN